jgi:hypothetical protein
VLFRIDISAALSSRLERADLAEAVHAAQRAGTPQAS